MTTPATALPSVPSLMFGLDPGNESQAFLEAFVLATDPTTLQLNVGGFLMTATAASQALAAGDATQHCLMGSWPLPAAKCASLLSTVMGMIPGVWSATMAVLSPAYGVGAAAPVFIRVTVEEALGLG